MKSLVLKLFAAAITLPFAGSAQTDFVNWSAFGPATTFVGSGSTIGSSNGTVNVTVANSGGFTVLQEGNGFVGDFTLGEFVLYSPNDISAQLVFSAGINDLTLPLEAAQPGAFTYSVSAYAVGGAFLGTITGSSANNQLENGSVLQVPVDFSDIGSLVISTVDPSDNGFALGTVTLDSEVVPEPGTFALASLGGLLWFRRRVSRVSR